MSRLHRQRMTKEGHYTRGGGTSITQGRVWSVVVFCKM